MATLHRVLSRYDLFTKACADDGAISTDVLPQSFARLFGEHTKEHLARDGHKPKKDRDYDKLIGMTFIGQFIDHDITLDATSAIGTKIAPLLHSQCANPKS